MTGSIGHSEQASLMAVAIEALHIPDPISKAHLTREYAEKWRQGSFFKSPGQTPNRTEIPTKPPRPEALRLLPPGQMPKRRLGSQTGRAALIHAIAHIELNAIDLAWDMIARFGPLAVDELDLGRSFLHDWVSVADDEARHCLMLLERLSHFDMAYGDLPAHDGLWQAAESTAHDFLARLAIVPMALEARGLDVTPDMCQRLREFGDEKTAEILDIIYQEEINHVRIGTHWFKAVCALKGQNPQEIFQQKLGKYFKGQLKPPFNNAARQAAGMPQEYYEGL